MTFPKDVLALAQEAERLRKMQLQAYGKNIGDLRERTSQLDAQAVSWGRQAQIPDADEALAAWDRFFRCLVGLSVCQAVSIEDSLDKLDAAISRVRTTFKPFA